MSYVEQLQVLARSGGKSGKARRFTSRSKLRAVQALKYFPSPSNGGEAKIIASYDWSSNDSNLWSFLYCWSEVQELRLPCSEETLGQSLGITLIGEQARISLLCYILHLFSTKIINRGPKTFLEKISLTIPDC